MEETYATRAIILKREPFRERDSRIVVLSPDRGKLELIVRGTKNLKSKMAGHIEPVSLVNFMVVRGRICDYAGNAINEKSYAGIKNDLSKLVWVGKSFNFLEKAIKPNETVDADRFFALLNDYLEIVDRGLKPENYEIFHNFFLLKSMSLLGYAPELYNCFRCREKILPQGNYFKPAHGGIGCGNCREARGQDDPAISDNCVKVLRSVLKDGLSRLAKFKIDNGLGRETINIIGSFKNYHADF
ncbi:DNA repair protein RecO [Candidatus Falkowbacteria bacterium RIFOXYB2_FULL_47_14]|uniref:DNA repair protein RecO n=1 Tax=Candidatus Falkowbacteria bacterium RIFOXYA2_FULL_47_19 TaxID=1797994 RepID=A0A1F5SI05_9BACT|nr:MAG: DNA repair protein RecO [Candidatus Falkowbacteria bacterium RIFOXYA2_FULL_47_19]OGF35435.1 MAG: DNA repair protein RecO [Candidatus Falkowbacteria bacterium RIFOXYC2_FULL_46_15]OGF42573.1 MAG: DNA repair protein RecO [Candidatus Falkowbacteria bacterium RIFOXYB2_FULL_47_14]